MPLRVKKKNRSKKPPTLKALVSPFWQDTPNQKITKRERKTKGKQGLDRKKDKGRESAGRVTTAARLGSKQSSRLVMTGNHSKHNVL